jgi:hypothetical protein
MRRAGIIMLSIGIPIMVCSAVALGAGTGILQYDTDSGGRPSNAAMILTFAGGGVLLASLPIVFIGGDKRRKGNRWKKSLEELLVYRQKVPLSSGWVQPNP